MAAKDTFDEPREPSVRGLLDPASTGRPEGDALRSMLARQPAPPPTGPLPQVVVGELIALADGGSTPLILYPGQPGTSALRARSVLDLHGAHIGQPVVLSFENGDAGLPIVMGVLKGAATTGLDPVPGQVQIDADGERMVVSAKEQLVLQCGKASITLTRTGKVLIQGSYVSSRSTGVNRVKGGSVQLN